MFCGAEQRATSGMLLKGTMAHLVKSQALQWSQSAMAAMLEMEHDTDAPSVIKPLDRLLLLQFFPADPLKLSNLTCHLQVSYIFSGLQVLALAVP